ncbi:polyketide synthase, putative [Talaromyces stipitatus ATCC 10500]|uniref:Polyketide synthase, putative n=1 Tax=Talaromyces stipitatus (strain ATCC 10500 / CBS 375.48 / QM 6759 / NRRL 1006) TaxID=441959 RepID=B8M7V1_TALSN|nr:polyketide synthase, putative [Talaromyces stipitatus ATCC 10500]EED19830.1 polyketide synthase, putative [Talaromyces stipitatus ATCC 10500]
MPHFDEPVHEDSMLEPIAIVGMACRLPGGINSSSSLWEALKEKQSMQTPKVPASRFNIDAYLHERLDRPGSFNVPGGYFLNGNAEDFDPTFFNITPIEAMWLDPQQRKMLEVTYECLESAGLTLEDVKGSNTAVFVGSFTSDYQQMSTKDGDFRHNYAATGVDPGLISARIGNTFDLNGPCFTINTACSSSIYAIHNACHALRTRDASAAIAGGVNLILTVDQHMNTAKLGILSPTSTCHTFDASADGYGRAEGAGALYLKRLSDAIRDGDPVRGVIRSSAVNTNGKVPGMGITHPSEDGQERVVRQAYARSGLDPLRTAYVECHGTGTPVGDPIEAHAIGRAMNDARPSDKPLLVGAIKANIGHSEAASGIFAVMKAALMTEEGVIPGVAGLKTLNPAIRENEWNIKVNVDTAPWPRGFAEKRAGVSSFGYGGTNGHVIIEAVDSLHPLYRHGHKRGDEPPKADRPFLLPFSAHDRRTLERNITAHAKVVSDYHLADIAYTLGVRRSRFATRGFTVAAEPLDPEDFALSAFAIGSAPRSQPDLAFIFTGQGAQWSGLGVQAMQAFPVFRSTIEALDQVLQQLDAAIRPTWSLKSSLLASAAAPNINDANVAQPVCTAVQIAIVDLFASWGIAPTVTVGHSSGEIAAAYAAGLISAPEAMIAAFLRGYSVSHHAPVGSMLAVGLGLGGLTKYQELLDKDLVIACQNSPESLTLSGTLEAVAYAKNVLSEDGVFARELPTGKAYHSPQMNDVAFTYDALLARAVEGLNDESLKWQRPRARWFSSVSGTEYPGDSVPASYWSLNLRNRVLFDEAVTSLGTAPGLEQVAVAIEIGPHSALAGPFKQICRANKLDRFTYVASLVRNKDSAVQLLKTAGALFIQNYPLDLEEVNSTEAISGNMKNKGSPLLLVDLPPYQWNYEKRYWVEPRFSHEQRNLTSPRHDLLGSKIVGLSDRSLAWRNVLRHIDLPWLKDHTLGKEAVFPAAAHLSMATEALRQVCDQRGIEIQSVTFRDVQIKAALIIPEVDDGIEVQLRLDKKQEDGMWYTFAVESFANGEWSLHSTGSVAANHIEAGTREHPVDLVKLTQRVPGKTWYKAFDRVGFEYGPSFQALSNIRTNGKYHHAAADVKVDTASGLVVGESRYMLHPSTIDGCLQLIIISINSGMHREMQHGVVPIKIEELTMWNAGEATKAAGRSIAWTDELDGRYFNTHTKLFAENGDILLDVKSLRCVSYEAAVPQTTVPPRPREPYMETVWKPDITTLTTQQALQTYPSIQLEEDSIAAIVELMQHKTHISSALLLGQADSKTLQAVLKQVAPTTKLVLAGVSEEHLESLTISIDAGNLSTVSSKKGLFDWGEQTLDAQDLVIVGKDAWSHTSEQELLTEVASLTVKGGKAIFSAPSHVREHFASTICHHGFSDPELLFPLPEVSIISATLFGNDPNGHAHPKHEVVILTSDEAARSSSSPIAAFLRESGCAVNLSDLREDIPVKQDKEVTYMIYDATGSLVSSLAEDTFERLKTVLTGSNPVVWLTSGVNEGSCVSGGMSQGLLRAIRSEQASAKILLLDADTTEDITSIGEAILSKLGHIATKDSGADTEYWLQNGILKIARVLPNELLNAHFSANLAPPQLAVLTSENALSGRIVNGELVFQSQSWNNSRVFAEWDVELQVQYASFNKADLQAPISGISIVAGPIKAVGSSLDESFVGRNAVAYAENPFCTVCTAPVSVGAFYSDFEAPALVATLPSLAQAINAVLDVGKVQANERVLLLAAPHDFVAAVAELKQVLGFQLTVIVESEQERQGLALRSGLPSHELLLAPEVKTIHSLLGGSGSSKPDLVVSHDFSPFSQEVWRAMPPASRFILNDTTIDGSLDALPFSKGVSLLLSGVRNLYKTRPSALGDLLTRTMSFMKEKKILWKPKIYDIGAISDVREFSLGQGIMENAVIKYDYDHSSVKVQPSGNMIEFSPNAAYFLVGCLGGLGRSLTTFMMERGARDFVFLSRSGADKPDAAALVESIQKAGAAVQVFRGDASVQADVDRAVNEVTATRTIKGVIHAAMVLQDGMFNNMTFNQFEAALKPKVNGADTLHKAFEKMPLDFFVMTSSISATMGNPGQANYCAGNSYLDSLAWHRNLRGLPATSLILPMVLDVGVVSENAGIEEALSRKAMYGIDERELLRGFETAMLQRPRNTSSPSLGDTQIILGLEPAYLANAIAAAETSDEAYWYQDSRFTHLRSIVEDIRTSAGSSSSREGTFVQELESSQALGPEAILHAISCHIAKKLSNMLLIPIEDFAFEGTSISVYGIDSMIGADLRNWLFKLFSLEVSFQHLLAPKMTILALARAVAEHLGLVEKAEA